MVGRAGMLAVVLVVLAGCGGDPSQPAKPLAAPGDDLCEALPGDVVREHLGIAVREVEATVLTSDTDICTYDLDAAEESKLSTALVTLPHRDRPRTVYLDDEFAERPGEKPGPYTKIDDLGEAAGFGRFVNTTQFVVISSDDVHIYKVVLQFENLDVTVEQARPVAERLLDGLDG